MSDFSFQVGDVVLCEWHDGKLYYAYIQTILSESQQCIVLFEDLHYYCVTYDKLHSVDEETTDIVCVICKGDRSDHPNEIVICDGCDYGFHRMCHKPAVPESAIEDQDQPWFCFYCEKGERCPYVHYPFQDYVRQYEELSDGDKPGFQDLYDRIKCSRRLLEKHRRTVDGKSRSSAFRHIWVKPCSKCGVLICRRFPVHVRRKTGDMTNVEVSSNRKAGIASQETGSPQKVNFEHLESNGNGVISPKGPTEVQDSWKMKSKDVIPADLVPNKETCTICAGINDRVAKSELQSQSQTPFTKLKMHVPRNFRKKSLFKCLVHSTPIVRLERLQDDFLWKRKCTLKDSVLLKSSNVAHSKGKLLSRIPEEDWNDDVFSRPDNGVKKRLVFNPRPDLICSVQKKEGERPSSNGIKPLKIKNLTDKNIGTGALKMSLKRTNSESSNEGVNEWIVQKATPDKKTDANGRIKIAKGLNCKSKHSSENYNALAQKKMKLKDSADRSFLKKVKESSGKDKCGPETAIIGGGTGGGGDISDKLGFSSSNTNPIEAKYNPHVHREPILDIMISQLQNSCIVQTSFALPKMSEDTAVLSAIKKSCITKCQDERSSCRSVADNDKDILSDYFIDAENSVSDPEKEQTKASTPGLSFNDPLSEGDTLLEEGDMQVVMSEDFAIFGEYNGISHEEHVVSEQLTVHGLGNLATNNQQNGAEELTPDELLIYAVNSLSAFDSKPISECAADAENVSVLHVPEIPTRQSIQETDDAVEGLIAELEQFQNGSPDVSKILGNYTASQDCGDDQGLSSLAQVRMPGVPEVNNEVTLSSNLIPFTASDVQQVLADNLNILKEYSEDTEGPPSENLVNEVKSVLSELLENVVKTTSSNDEVSLVIDQVMSLQGSDKYNSEDFSFHENQDEDNDNLVIDLPEQNLNENQTEADGQKATSKENYFIQTIKITCSRELLDNQNEFALTFPVDIKLCSDRLYGIVRTADNLNVLTTLPDDYVPPEDHVETSFRIPIHVSSTPSQETPVPETDTSPPGNDEVFTSAPSVPKKKTARKSTARSARVFPDRTDLVEPIRGRKKRLSIKVFETRARKALSTKLDTSHNDSESNSESSSEVSQDSKADFYIDSKDSTVAKASPPIANVPRRRGRPRKHQTGSRGPTANPSTPPKQSSPRHTRGIARNRGIRGRGRGQASVPQEEEAVPHTEATPDEELPPLTSSKRKRQKKNKMATTPEMSPALNTEDRLSREFPRHNWLENKLQQNYTGSKKQTEEVKKKLVDSEKQEDEEADAQISKSQDAAEACSAQKETAHDRQTDSNGVIEVACEETSQKTGEESENKSASVNAMEETKSNGKTGPFSQKKPNPPVQKVQPQVQQPQAYQQASGSMSEGGPLINQTKQLLKCVTVNNETSNAQVQPIDSVPVHPIACGPPGTSFATQIVTEGQHVHAAPVLNQPNQPMSGSVVYKPQGMVVGSRHPPPLLAPVSIAMISSNSAGASIQRFTTPITATPQKNEVQATQPVQYIVATELASPSPCHQASTVLQQPNSNGQHTAIHAMNIQPQLIGSGSEQHIPPESPALQTHSSSQVAVAPSDTMTSSQHAQTQPMHQHQQHPQQQQHQQQQQPHTNAAEGPNDEMVKIEMEFEKRRQEFMQLRRMEMEAERKKREFHRQSKLVAESLVRLDQERKAAYAKMNGSVIGGPATSTDQLYQEGQYLVNSTHESISSNSSHVYSTSPVVTQSTTEYSHSLMQGNIAGRQQQGLVLTEKQHLASQQTQQQMQHQSSHTMNPQHPATRTLRPPPPLISTGMPESHNNHQRTSPGQHVSVGSRPVNPWGQANSHSVTNNSLVAAPMKTAIFKLAEQGSAMTVPTQRTPPPAHSKKQFVISAPRGMAPPPAHSKVHPTGQVAVKTPTSMPGTSPSAVAPNHPPRLMRPPSQDGQRMRLPTPRSPLEYQPRQPQSHPRVQVPSQGSPIRQGPPALLHQDSLPSPRANQVQQGYPPLQTNQARFSGELQYRMPPPGIRPQPPPLHHLPPPRQIVRSQSLDTPNQLQIQSTQNQFMPARQAPPSYQSSTQHYHNGNNHLLQQQQQQQQHQLKQQPPASPVRQPFTPVTAANQPHSMHQSMVSNHPTLIAAINKPASTVSTTHFPAHQGSSPAPYTPSQVRPMPIHSEQHHNNTAVQGAGPPPLMQQSYSGKFTLVPDARGTPPEGTIITIPADPEVATTQGKQTPIGHEDQQQQLFQQPNTSNSYAPPQQRKDNAYTVAQFSHENLASPSQQPRKMASPNQQLQEGLKNSSQIDQISLEQNMFQSEQASTTTVAVAEPPLPLSSHSVTASVSAGGSLSNSASPNNELPNASGSIPGVERLVERISNTVWENVNAECKGTRSDPIQNEASIQPSEDGKNNTAGSSGVIAVENAQPDEQTSSPSTMKESCSPPVSNAPGDDSDLKEFTEADLVPTSAEVINEVASDSEKKAPCAEAATSQKMEPAGEDSKPEGTNECGRVPDKTLESTVQGSVDTLSDTKENKTDIEAVPSAGIMNQASPSGDVSDTSLQQPSHDKSSSPKADHVDSVMQDGASKAADSPGKAVTPLNHENLNSELSVSIDEMETELGASQNDQENNTTSGAYQESICDADKILGADANMPLQSEESETGTGPVGEIHSKSPVALGPSVPMVDSTLSAADTETATTYDVASESVLALDKNSEPKTSSPEDLTATNKEILAASFVLGVPLNSAMSSVMTKTSVVSFTTNSRPTISPASGVPLTSPPKNTPHEPVMNENNVVINLSKLPAAQRPATPKSSSSDDVQLLYVERSPASEAIRKRSVEMPSHGESLGYKRARYEDNRVPPPAHSTPHKVDVLPLPSQGEMMVQREIEIALMNRKQSHKGGQGPPAPTIPPPHPVPPPVRAPPPRPAPPYPTTPPSHIRPRAGPVLQHYPGQTVTYGSPQQPPQRPVPVSHSYSVVNRQDTSDGLAHFQSPSHQPQQSHIMIQQSTQPHLANSSPQQQPNVHYQQHMQQMQQSQVHQPQTSHIPPSNQQMQQYHMPHPAQNNPQPLAPVQMVHSQLPLKSHSNEIGHGSHQIVAVSRFPQAVPEYVSVPVQSRQSGYPEMQGNVSRQPVQVAYSHTGHPVRTVVVTPAATRPPVRHVNPPHQGAVRHPNPGYVASTTTRAPIAPGQLPGNHSPEQYTGQVVNIVPRPSIDPNSMERICSVCKRKASFLCSGCRKIWYCSSECQSRAWETHSFNCT